MRDESVLLFRIALGRKGVMWNLILYGGIFLSVVIGFGSMWGVLSYFRYLSTALHVTNELSTLIAIIGSLMASIALCLLLCFFFYELAEKNRAEGCTVPVVAKIVRVIKSVQINENHPDRDIFTPVYEYTAPDGKKVEIKALESSYQEGVYQVGQDVNLLINPDSPQRYKKVYTDTATDKRQIRTFRIVCSVIIAVGVLLIIFARMIY